MKQITKFNFSKLLTLAMFLLVLFGSGQQAKAESQDETIWRTPRENLSDIDAGPIIKVLYTPDEQSILVTTTTKRLFELDPATGKVRREIPGIAGVIQFSEDGQYVYTYNFEKVKWPGGELVGKFPVQGLTDFKINEKVGLLIGVYNFYKEPLHPWEWKRGVFIFDLKTFQLIDTLGFKDCYYMGVDITHNGKYAIIYGGYAPYPQTHDYDTSFTDVWELSTMTLHSFSPKTLPIWGDISVSPDGKYLGVPGAPYVRVYDNQAFSNDLTLKIIYEWNPCYGCASDVTAFSPDSRYLLSQGENCSYPNDPNDSLNINKTRVWDLKTGKLVYVYHAYMGNHFIFNKNLNLLTYGTGAVGLLKFGSVVDVSDLKTAEETLYPNPTNGIITIKNGKLIAGQPLQIAISDISGKTSKILYNGIYNGNEINLNISEYPAGTYLLQVNQKVQIATYKVIKE